ncbi:xanthine dehydrogenase accessory protein XdhC [Aminobacter sp. HY435]|uniref:xanthine dehydrogenase accessory protein XdhC n=1 Tax=Aminobacter sp. HY435 TaxID=2970917 RepID=UPI0022B9B71B|nr:xanthine dehydrogenase accessory protein XdhC [Aminobacter sp. HY435]
MSTTAKSLRAFLDAAPSVALVEVTEAKGSTPREKGAWMLVSPERIFGTIGGGQLEFMAIDTARAMLKGSTPSPLWGGSIREAERGGGEAGSQVVVTLTPALRADPPHKGEGGAITLDIPLGPEIGQCCGGRVEVAVRSVDEAMRADLLASAEASDAARPHVYVFGGGHVGHALASAFALLPLNVVIIETRADALEGMPGDLDVRLTPVPEEMVREAPAGSAFVVLTHDHALDFLIVAEALKRDDTCYVGMIGSRTKKATFRSWFLKTADGSEEDFARLVCPIGGDAVKDKRPAVIAALAAAEIMTALAFRAK